MDTDREEPNDSVTKEVVETSQVGEESKIESTQVEDGPDDSNQEELKDKAGKVAETTRKKKKDSIDSSSRDSSSRARRHSLLDFLGCMLETSLIQTSRPKGIKHE